MTYKYIYIHIYILYILHVCLLYYTTACSRRRHYFPNVFNILAWWRYRSIQIWVNIGWGDCLLPYGTKPLFEPVSISYSSEINLTRSIHELNPYHLLGDYTFIVTATSCRGKWVNCYVHYSNSTLIKATFTAMFNRYIYAPESVLQNLSYVTPLLMVVSLCNWKRPCL